mgnify:FL=1
MQAQYRTCFEELVPGLVVHAGDPDPATLAALIADAEIVVDGHTELDAATLDAAPKLRHVVFLGTGADFYINPDDAAARGVTVHTVRGYGDRAVAEHALALTFAVARRLAWMDAEMRAGRWSPAAGIELAGRRFGVIGAGGIGRATAALAAAIGMEVVVWNRSAAGDVAGRQLTALEDLLATSDVVSIHLAATPETARFLGRERLATMRDGAILVNTARGALIDHDALLDALDDGDLLGAGLDVFDAEPLPRGSRLRTHPRLVLSPHAAFNTVEASRRLLQRGLETTRDLLATLA